MALHINLLHEVLRQERERQRDPLKLGMFALAAVALLFVAYYFVRVGQVHGVTSRARTLEDEWRKLEPKQQAAVAEETEINNTLKTTESLVQRIENRFHWAPFLQLIVETVPADVQITRLQGKSTGDGPTRKCTIDIEGVSAGDQPRAVAENLRTALFDKFSAQFTGVSGGFRTLEDGSETVQRDGVALPTALFTLHYEFERPDPSAPVAPGRETARATP
jgi:Tfp pilus assembly protein PilN